MEFDNELTFEQIGNMTSEEIDKPNEEIVSDGDESPFANEEPDEGDFFIPSDDEDQEGVANEDSQEDEEESSAKSEDSPNVFASIASALREDNILNLLDDSDFENIKDATNFVALFNKQVENMLDDKQKRINDALNAGLEPNVIQQYENALSTVNSISEDNLNAETKEGETLRGQILIQDYMNKGFDIDRAKREASKAFEAGTDIEDARDALADMKTFYTKGYTDSIKDADNLVKEAQKKEAAFAKKLEKRFLETEEPIKGMKLNKAERNKLYRQYSKFVDKDDKGNPLTELQKYAKDNPEDYQYNINALYYLTDGFKNLSKVVSKEVKKQTKSAFSNLETTLKSSNNSIGTGSINFGNDKSSESFEG